MNFLKSRFGFLFNKEESKKFFIQTFYFTVLLLLVQGALMVFLAAVTKSSPFFIEAAEDISEDAALAEAVGGIKEIKPPFWGCSFHYIQGSIGVKCDLRVIGSRDEAEVMAYLTMEEGLWVLKKAHGVKSDYGVLLIKQ